MTKKTKNKTTKYTYRYRAFCRSCTFRGEWHNDKESTRHDAEKHKQDTGHTTSIEKEQTQDDKE